jgi:hypothetical protein
MAVKQVERRICDSCEREVSNEPCCLCHKDFCYSHGDIYRPGSWQKGRPKSFALCDDCTKDVVEKLGAVLKTEGK